MILFSKAFQWMNLFIFLFKIRQKHKRSRKEKVEDFSCVEIYTLDLLLLVCESVY